MPKVPVKAIPPPLKSVPKWQEPHAKKPPPPPPPSAGGQASFGNPGIDQYANKCCFAICPECNTTSKSTVGALCCYAKGHTEPHFCPVCKERGKRWEESEEKGKCRLCLEICPDCILEGDVAKNAICLSGTPGRCSSAAF
jgi:hypothetical protein